MNSNVSAIVTLLSNNLQFRASVSFLAMEQALRLYNATGEFPYNGMPSNMLDIVGKIEKALGRTQYPQLNGKDNPNTGNTCHASIQIGNEYSFVIYIRVVGAYPINKTHDEIKSDLRGIAKEFRANEFSIREEFGSFEARMWWD